MIFNSTYGGDDPYDPSAVLQGYWVSYVTAYGNGLYGVYAFGARGGLFEESYASGHPDSGFYIGRCDPCDAVVRHVTATGNVVGFQGTNASGNLFIVESEWRGNRVGIEPNSDTEEGNLPQHDATIVGNVVADNGNPATPPSDTGEFGYGIAIGGASRDVVERNLVVGNANTGIALLGDNKGFLASENRVAGNVLSDNGVDLEYLSPTGEARGNCFEGNQFTTSFPADIQRVLPCPPPAAAAVEIRPRPPPRGSGDPPGGAASGPAPAAGAAEPSRCWVGPRQAGDRNARGRCRVHPGALAPVRHRLLGAEWLPRSSSAAVVGPMGRPWHAPSRGRSRPERRGRPRRRAPSNFQAEGAQFLATATIDGAPIRLDGAVNWADHAGSGFLSVGSCLSLRGPLDGGRRLPGPARPPRADGRPGATPGSLGRAPGRPPEHPPRRGHRPPGRPGLDLADNPVNLQQQADVQWLGSDTVDTDEVDVFRKGRIELYVARANSMLRRVLAELAFTDDRLRVDVSDFGPQPFAIPPAEEIVDGRDIPEIYAELTQLSVI